MKTRPNLHRREISQIERAELVAEWVRITTDRKLAQDGPVSERGIVEGRGNKGGAREAARKLGMTRQTVGRSLKVAALSPEAKEALCAVYQSDTPPPSSRP